MGENIEYKEDSCQNRIALALSMRRMKPIDLSLATGIPKASISHYLNGRSDPKQDRIYLMAKALNVSETWLMGYAVAPDRIDPKKNQKLELPIEERYLLSQYRKLSETDRKSVITMVDELVEHQVQ